MSVVPENGAETKEQGPRRRRLSLQAIPAEGEGGLITQSWYPICMSSELPQGKVLGTGFLDGRVIVFRGEDGVAQVLSAYCPHMGADLSQACVEAGTIQCPFHQWKFDTKGECVATAVGDAPPRDATLFRFPTAEKFGLIWAFNGEKALFDIPGFPELEAQDDLLFRAEANEPIVGIDPWVLASSTVDFQHLRTVHAIEFNPKDPADIVEWSDYGVSYEISGHLPTGQPYTGKYAAAGTNIYYSSGTLGGRWFGLVCPFAIPTPGTTRVFVIGFVRKSEGDDIANQAFLDGLVAYEQRMCAEDAAVLKVCHFRPGAPTRSDRSLLRFLDYVRNYPRAHPSADFIR